MPLTRTATLTSAPALATTPAAVALPNRMPFLKRLFWAYFLLLIFEGALRKWLIPQFSAPLLIIRDPLGLWIIWEAYRTRKWPAKWTTVTAVLCVSVIGLTLVQLVVGDNSGIAALFGVRSYLLPFPVAFIMAENLTTEDLRKFGTCILWLLLPLTALELIQYISPPTSFWNTGASEGAVQLGYAQGHVRASATFSYVMGPMFYTPLAGAFVFYGLVDQRFAKKWLLWAGAGALVLSIPLIGSRTVVYEMAALVGCVALAALFGVSQLVKSIKMMLVILFVGLLVSQLPIFSEATETMVSRFTDATTAEGGSAGASLYERIVQPITLVVGDSVANNDFLGMGMGRGANAITRLISGQVTFAAGEETVVRTIHECGWPFGIAFLLFRYALAISIAIASILKAKEQPLALLLLPLTFHALALGGLDQPTTQGFTVFGLAFSLAALREERSQIVRRDLAYAKYRTTYTRA
jgi:hypothetical protein